MGRKDLRPSSRLEVTVIGFRWWTVVVIRGLGVISILSQTSGEGVLGGTW